MRRGISLLLVITLAFFPCDALAAKGNLKVVFLDVGQGDAIYIEAPNGRQMIIDGGPKNALLSALEEVLPFFDRSIDVVMVTNPDADHYSGFISLLDMYEVGAVVEAGTISKTSTHAEFQKEIIDKKIPQLLARRGMTIDLDVEDGVRFTVLFPDRDVSLWSTNDGSIEGILSYGTTKIFFTGDGSKKTESIILSENSRESLRSDILKVGHHGSRSATADDFVAAVAPTYAVISLGKNNTYGHPHTETLDTLLAYKAQILRTDQEGSIIFFSDGVHFYR